MEETDEENRDEEPVVDRQAEGGWYPYYYGYRGVYSAEAHAIGRRGIFSFYLLFLLEHAFKDPLHYFFGKLHLGFYAIFLLLLMYILYRIIAKLSFRKCLVLFIISIIYVLNNGGLSLFTG